MPDIVTVDRIVAATAGATSRKNGFVEAMDAPTADADGGAALRVTIVVRNASGKERDGETAPDPIVELQRAVMNAGEERFAVVDFAAEQERDEDGGS